MFRWLIIAGLVIGAVWGMQKTWHNWHSTPEPIGGPIKVASSSKDKQKGDYDISLVHFLHRVGNTVTTREGVFKVGNMSRLGFVEAVVWRPCVFKLRGPDHRYIYAVVEEQEIEHDKTSTNNVHSDHSDKTHSETDRTGNGAKIIDIPDHGILPAISSPFQHEVAPYGVTGGIPTIIVPLPTPAQYPAYHNGVPIAPRPIATPIP